jgi:hypothetical protein
MRSTCLLLLFLTGCGPRSIDLPTPPPSAAPPVALYDHPTGTVPLEQLAAVAGDAQDRFDLLDGSRLMTLLQSLLAALRQRLEAGGLPYDPGGQGLEANVEGYIRVRRICAGWSQGTAPDPAQGTQEATALVRNGRLERDLWLTATACHATVDVAGSLDVHAFVDGALAITLLGPLSTSTMSANLAVHLDATLGDEERRVPLTLDFRLVYPKLEVLRTVDDGVIVASVGADGIELRGANGTFTCSVSSSMCGPEAPQ